MCICQLREFVLGLLNYRYIQLGYSQAFQTQYHAADLLYTQTQIYVVLQYYSTS